MCIAAISWNAHPRWHLVIAANRDERHDRPAAALARWDDGSGIITGKDIQGSGTWLGLTERAPPSGPPGSCRLVLVTNFRNPGLPDPARPSRGGLVTALLDGADPGQIQPGAYNPFNLMVATPSGAEFLTNHPAPLSVPLTPGIHGLANGPIDPPWQKTTKLETALARWLENPDPDFDPLFSALSDRSPTSTQWPAAGPEPRVSSIFIANPAYGTRCSTVIAIDRAGNGRIIERSFGPNGTPGGEVALEFGWDQS